MKNCRIYHDALVIEIAHKAGSLEVEDFESSVFARRKEPLIVSLEVKRSDIASMAFKQALLV